MASESPNNSPKHPRKSRGGGARPAEHGSERRLITALCYDLVGSTNLFHQLDIEDFQELISAFQQAVRSAIVARSGVMRVEAGDGGVALFPTELGSRDAASLAIRAGFDVIEACRRIGREARRSDVHVRVGIATSIALVQEPREEVPSQEPVTGAALAMATRLEALAAPDSILVSEETKTLAGRAYAFIFEGSRSLKGFAEPQRVWRALEHRTEVTRFYAFGRLGGSFIGRAAELETIGRCWREVLVGKGQILAIEGDAGIGKSRLLREIRKLTRKERSRAFLFQCAPGGARSTLHPLMHGFPGTASKAAGSSRLTATTVAAAFAHHGIEEPDVAELFSYLLGAAGRNESLSGSDPKAIRDRARRATIHALETVAARGPLIMAVEDIHWIDPTSQDLLGEIARTVSRLPILLVVTLRPGAAMDWTDGADVVHLSLKPLNRDETKQAIEASWPAHKRRALPELLEATERLSGGVPLFIEEICQWITEIAPADAANIPEAIAHDGEATVSHTHALAFEGILDERLARLGPARDVARAAAIAGGRMTLPLLHALLPDLARRSLASAADVLCETGFLTRGRTGGTVVYRFRHALIQETIYKALLRKQRQVLHRRLFNAVSDNRGLAEWIDTGGLADQAERAGLTEEAIRLFIAAGSESAGRSAMIEARHHLEHALALCAEMDESEAVDALRLSAFTRLGPILTGLVGANSPPARKLYEDGVAIARRQPKEDQPKWFPIYWGWWLTGPDFLVMHDRALEVQMMMLGTEDREIALQVKHCIWAIDFNLGWHKETQEAITTGLALYDERSAETARTLYGGHDAKVCGLGQLALSLWLTGQGSASDTALADMVGLVERIGHVPSTAHSLDTEAVSAFYRDDFERLADVSSRMQLFAQQHEMQSLAGMSLLFGGWAKAHSDDLLAGHEMFGEGLALLKDLGAVADLPIYLYMHATLLGLAGKYEQAIDVVTDAIRQAKETGHAYWLAELYRCRAVLRARGNVKTNLVAAELLTAVTIAESQGAMALLQRASRSTRELGVVIGR
ncbi:ATP-binding protein [Rhizobium mesosinicum]|uniref:AAA family ATPase n=1 Tax=Rhizobium mesosinicum TaxID=335017 RepID=A0ABS7GSR9_9HYPH|nr:AAA family ATPase [Rhizobium mesosinicum]MBW9052420.1 AAA family ATPase [Rhizobium mesosinicum]